MKEDILKIGNREFTNRLFTGTGKFSSKKLIPEMLRSSGSEMITVAVRRVNFDNANENIIDYIPKDVQLLPNTSGSRTAEEAVRIARISREALGTDFIKIEVITDSKYLMPDNEETLKATEILAKEGFTVLPYVMADLIISKKLEDVGAAAIMPLGSPIGTNQGFKTKNIVEMILETVSVPVVVDAGIGKPSHACECMELGVDAVLVNTAISTAEDPVLTGEAFSLAVKAGRMAYLSNLAGVSRYAEASSPLTGFLRD